MEKRVEGVKGSPATNSGTEKQQKRARPKRPAHLTLPLPSPALLVDLLHSDGADLELGDHGHRVQGIDGQQVDRCFSEVEGHENNPGRKVVRDLGLRADLTPARGHCHQAIVR
ncbi:MAG: hypothetical protein H6Q41_1734, partial [Deltaproteobacteria bacterium]|nr:hypothetical protein [Deltaproteobacteria bacterium]